MNILIYIIKTVFISGLLFGYYRNFLRNRRFHGFNRFFLLGIPVLSFLLPVLHFTLPVFGNPSSSAFPIRLLGVGRGTLEEAVTIYANRQKGFGISWPMLAGICSIGMSLFLLYRLYASIRYLRQLRKQNPFLQLPEATLYFVHEKGTPFSFFRSIFWGRDMELNNAPGQQILRHELFHVKQFHSMDILLLELVSTGMWFNPFFYLIRQELKAIHEYSADAYAAAGADQYAYASLLLLKVSGNSLSLTNPFFKNQIKRRIAMITKTSHRRSGLLSRFMILPLITVVVCLFSFKIQNHFKLLSPKMVRVVIDPGHGGLYPGVSFNGIYEKDINLSIAKKIQSLSKEYQVDVVMTRENDEDAAGNDLRASLDYRAALAEKKKADLFISIHINGTDQGVIQDSYSGFEIYVPKSASKEYEHSVKLASIISGYIKPDFSIAPELKQRAERIRVIDNANVPAILIECGYMDNKKDLAYLQDAKEQEKIARDILEGIRKYSVQTVSYVQHQNGSADTITYEAMSKLDPAMIESVTVEYKNKTDGRILIKLKNGENDVVIVTEDLRKKLDASRDHQTSSPENRDTIPNPIFTQVEAEAGFPGGQTAWYQYLSKHLKYPDDAVKHEIQGTVVVEFIVKKDGSLTNIHAISGPDVLRAESVRVITESGRWVPATNNKIRVDSYHKQPLNYKLEEQSSH